ncbi:iron-siderophore ABC transporter substrate-binding protein [Leptolyngbya sp. AN03gr2]|uniref:iron-siderophore ABC transporter substrate-binding protein n=1 Tax=unclassified Leptolyngbya TaxID=2650499 RepID=UPI003D321F9B
MGLFQTHAIDVQARTVSDCRIVQHELGESCIPRHPKRVIVMDQEGLEILVALGIQPIASTIPNRVASKFSLLQDQVGAIADLGKDGQPNLEKIVQLHPDLILGTFITPQSYSLLSQIAPTVSIEYSQTGWKQTLLEVADVVDRRFEAEKRLRDYQQRIEMMKAKVGSLKICIMRFYTDLQFTQFLNQNSFAVSVLDDTKVLTIPAIQRQIQQIPNSEYGYVNVSLERIDLLEADAIFVALDPGAEKNFQIYQNSSLWQTLDVAKARRVYTVDSGYWIFGNVLSANEILKDLVKHLADREVS